MFKLNNWISTRCYKTCENLDLAYIINHKSNEFIVLDGDSAKIWDMITSSKNESAIIEYTKENGCFDELEPFISELISLGLLSNCSILKKTGNCQLNKIQTYTNEDIDPIIGTTYLQRLFIELNYNCNLRCIHCFNDKSCINEISFKKIKPFIDEAINLGLLYITLSGGECTLNKDFLKIAKYIRKNKIALEIYTNGQILNDDDKLFDNLVAIYPHMISLSLYSMNPDIHDKITGVKGSQIKTLNVIKKLKEKNINIGIKTFLTNQNANEYRDIERFAKDNQINCTVDYLLLDNPLKTNQQIEITNKQITKLLLDKESICYMGNIPPEEFNKNSSICSGGYSSLSINPNYDIYICPSLKILLGNCLKDSLTQIWNQKDINTPLGQIRQLRKKDLKQCHTKEYCKYCIYCPGIAADSNNYLEPYERFCRIAKLKLEAKKIIDKNCKY